MATDRSLDVERVRGHFDFVARGRIVTNNAASTQPPRELMRLDQELVPGYENVHRGQSTASQVIPSSSRARTTPSPRSSTLLGGRTSSSVATRPRP